MARLSPFVYRPRNLLPDFLSCVMPGWNTTRVLFFWQTVSMSKLLLQKSNADSDV